MRLMGAIFGTVIGATLATWTLDRTADIETLSAVAVADEVVPGDNLIVEYSVNRLEACSADSVREIIDSQGVHWNLGTSHRAIGKNLGRETYRRVYLLPKTMPVGPATLIVDVTYVCNPIHYFWPVIKDPPTIVHFTVK